MSTRPAIAGNAYRDISTVDDTHSRRTREPRFAIPDIRLSLKG